MEKAAETANDTRENTLHVRLTCLGPAGDPINEAEGAAKKGYDGLPVDDRGSPHPYKAMAAMDGRPSVAVGICR